ncbi:uncharacterized protein K452DRAFT_289507, partial [Aplosporella prunicola CBS 121167]
MHCVLARELATPFPHPLTPNRKSPRPKTKTPHPRGHPRTHPPHRPPTPALPPVPPIPTPSRTYYGFPAKTTNRAGSLCSSQPATCDLRLATSNPAVPGANQRPPKSAQHSLTPPSLRGSAPAPAPAHHSVVLACAPSRNAPETPSLAVVRACDPPANAKASCLVPCLLPPASCDTANGARGVIAACGPPLAAVV